MFCSRQKEGRIRGIHASRFLIFHYGVLHGWMKRAVLNPDTKMLESGYLTGHFKNYQNFLATVVLALEESLHNDRCHAAQLLLEGVSIERNRGAEEEESPTSIRAKQMAKQAASRRAAEADRYLEICQELITILSRISSEELKCKEKLLSNAAKLQSVFCRYGEGALRRQALVESHVPDLKTEADRAWQLYEKQHAAGDQRIREFVERSLQNEY